MCVWFYMYVHIWPPSDAKRSIRFLVQVTGGVASGCELPDMCVGSSIGSSIGSVNTFNYRALSPAQCTCLCLSVCMCVYVCMYVCVCVCTCTSMSLCIPYMCQCLWKSENGVKLPKTAVTSGCEWPNIGAGN